MISGLGGGDPTTQMAILQIQSGESEKQISNSIRKTAEAQEREEDDKEYQDTEAKASTAMWAGISSGVGQMAAGAFTMAGAATTSSDKAKSLGAWGQVADGAGKVGSAILSSQSTNDGAEAERAKTAADHAKNVAQDAREFAKDEQDGIDKMISGIQDIKNTQNETNQAIIHRA